MLHLVVLLSLSCVVGRGVATIVDVSGNQGFSASGLLQSTFSNPSSLLLQSDSQTTGGNFGFLGNSFGNNLDFETDATFDSSSASLNVNPDSLAILSNPMDSSPSFFGNPLLDVDSNSINIGSFSPSVGTGFSSSILNFPVKRKYKPRFYQRLRKPRHYLPKTHLGITYPKRRRTLLQRLNVFGGRYIELPKHGHGGHYY